MEYRYKVTLKIYLAEEEIVAKLFKYLFGTMDIIRSWVNLIKEEEEKHEDAISMKRELLLIDIALSDCNNRKNILSCWNGPLLKHELIIEA